MKGGGGRRAAVLPGTVRPVVDHPALLLEPRAREMPRRLIVADLHLGLGGEEPRRGVPAETSAREMAEEILGIARREATEHLLIAGDVKHPIVGTPRPLRPVLFDFFSQLLGDGLVVDLVPGNHDVGITPWLPREVTVHPAAGIVVDGVGVFHGHCWPSARVLRSPRLVAGHLHPGIRLAPSAERPTGKEKCWLRVSVKAGRASGKIRPSPVKAQEVVLLPAFNPLAGTESLNREKPRRGRSFLFRRFVRLGEARAYLLDGTDLGSLATIGRGPASGAARGAGSDR